MNEFKEKTIEIAQQEQQREKRTGKNNEQRLRDKQDDNNTSNIYIMRFPEREEKKDRG